MSAKNNCVLHSIDIKHARWSLRLKGERTCFHGHMPESAANGSKDSPMSKLKCCCYWLGQRFDLVTRKRVFKSQTNWHLPLGRRQNDPWSFHLLIESTSVVLMTGMGSVGVEWSLASSLILPLNSNGFRWELPLRLLKGLDSAHGKYQKKYSSKQSLKSYRKGEYEKWNIHKNRCWIATGNQTMSALWQINLCNGSVATKVLNRKSQILCAFMLVNIFFYLYYKNSFHIVKYKNKLPSNILVFCSPRISFIIL